MFSFIGQVERPEQLSVYFLFHKLSTYWSKQIRYSAKVLVKERFLADQVVVEVFSKRRKVEGELCW